LLNRDGKYQVFLFAGKVLFVERLQEFSKTYEILPSPAFEIKFPSPLIKSVGVSPSIIGSKLQYTYRYFV
jgi:hypothetical protein